MVFVFNETGFGLAPPKLKWKTVRIYDVIIQFTYEICDGIVYASPIITF